MRTPLSHTPFSGSELLRVLTSLSVMKVTEAGNLFAEKLGYWVGFADAIVLHGVHNTGESLPSGKQGDVKSPAFSGESKWLGARTRLEKSVRQSFVANADLFIDEAIPYAMVRKFYTSHQRDMELGVRPLRLKARELAAQISPSLAKVAALDAAFEAILADREKRMLGTIPLLMEWRFKHLRSTICPPQKWLAHFKQELQTVLLAELDLRLLPAAGLMSAINEQIDQNA
jgi:hypothetical protein